MHSKLESGQRQMDGWMQAGHMSKPVWYESSVVHPPAIITLALIARSISKLRSSRSSTPVLFRFDRSPHSGSPISDSTRCSIDQNTRQAGGQEPWQRRRLLLLNASGHGPSPPHYSPTCSPPSCCSCSAPAAAAPSPSWLGWAAAARPCQ